MENTKKSLQINIKNANKLVAKRIWEYRIQQGISRNTLAKALGISQQQVEKYEKGLNRISAGMIAAISELLGTRPEFFYQDLVTSNMIFSPNAEQRMHAELVKNFQRIKNARHKKLILITSRLLADNSSPPDKY